MARFNLICCLSEAVELMAAFEAREIYRESTAVLILFQRACEEERMTAELARQLAELLRKGKRQG